MFGHERRLAGIGTVRIETAVPLFGKTGQWMSEVSACPTQTVIVSFSNQIGFVNVFSILAEIVGTDRPVEFVWSVSANPMKGHETRVDTAVEPKLTRASQVYLEIRSEIIEGRLSPGLKLQFDHLRERFGVGISPIREALSKLSSDGWVTHEERRGFVVADVSLEELKQLVRTRALIDALAAEEAMRLNETEAEEALVLAFHRLSKERRLKPDGGRNRTWERLHRQFHFALVCGCRLESLTEYSLGLFDRSERYRLLSAATYPERNELNEHKAILDSFISRDSDRLRTLIAQHYDVTLTLISRSHFPGED